MSYTTCTQFLFQIVLSSIGLDRTLLTNHNLFQTHVFCRCLFPPSKLTERVDLGVTKYPLIKYKGTNVLPQ